MIANFPKARDFAEALNDICMIEEKLEKARRDLALRTDFNLWDATKLFTQNSSKVGVDCDDLYFALHNILEVPVTKDEVFLIFFNGDKDHDGFWNSDEFKTVFTPNDKDYA